MLQMQTLKASKTAWDDDYLAHDIQTATTSLVGKSCISKLLKMKYALLLTLMCTRIISGRNSDDASQFKHSSPRLRNQILLRPNVIIRAQTTISQVNLSAQTISAASASNSSTAPTAATPSPTAPCAPHSGWRGRSRGYTGCGMCWGEIVSA
jgi:hypothetical protein